MASQTRIFFTLVDNVQLCHHEYVSLNKILVLVTAMLGNQSFLCTCKYEVSLQLKTEKELKACDADSQQRVF